MGNIKAPRYESSVDAYVGSFLHTIFPAEGTFKVVAHHKVRKEVDIDKSLDERYNFASVVMWMNKMHGARDADDEVLPPDIEGHLKEMLLPSHTLFDDPLFQSTPGGVGATTFEFEDGSGFLDALHLTPSRVPRNFLHENSVSPSTSNVHDYSHAGASVGPLRFEGSLGRNSPSPEAYTGQSSTSLEVFYPPDTPASGKRWDVLMPDSDFSAPDTCTPQVSGFPDSSTALENSEDSLWRRVPGRGHGHAPHGAPDFMVIRQDTGEVLMIVEDKLEKDPTDQLRRYSLFFPASLDIWYLGCRVSQESESGLEFMLADRDRTMMEAPIRNVHPTGGWFPWNSAEFLRRMRHIAELSWKEADYYPSDPVD